LVRLRIAVAGRTALEHVRDVDVAPLQADLREQLLEQLSRLPDEREALFVLVEPRRLADEHQVGVLATRAEDDLRAPLREAAPGAACDGSAVGLEIVEALNGDSAHGRRLYA